MVKIIQNWNDAVLTVQNSENTPPRQQIQTPQLMRAKPFYLTARASTDGQTDRQGDSSIPLTSLRGV